MAADLILYNGEIHTVDKRNSMVQALAIKDGRFIGVGADEEVKKLGDRTTTLIDLKGKTVIPGIVDSHNHIISAGMLLKGVMLFGAPNIKELQQRVAAKVAEAQPGEWIIGGGWIESQFEEYRAPTRWDLDEVAPENPVILSRLFGAAVVNSKALELAGIDRHTPDPWRGKIDRNQDTGEPTGVLRDNAVRLVRKVMPQRAIEDQVSEMQANITRALREYQKWGITTVVDPGVTPLARYAYYDLYRKGELPLRVNMMPAWYGLYATQDQYLHPLVEHMGIVSGFGNDWLSLGALKMAIDGGLGSKTALMHEPFIDGSRSTIPLRLDIDKLEEYFTLAHQHGWSLGIHCCGDRAQDIAVDTFARAISKKPRSEMRHNIIHGYFPTESTLEKMQQHNIAVSVQPVFMYVEGDIYFDVIEEHRIERFKPLRTYLDAGIVVAANSDMTSAHYNPFLGMYAAVARKTSQGRSLGDRERISRQEMIRLFTINGAYLAFMEDRVGSIEVGKNADLAVLSDDLLTIAEEEIKDLRVEMTVVAGQIVHQA